MSHALEKWTVLIFHFTTRVPAGRLVCAGPSLVYAVRFHPCVCLFFVMASAGARKGVTSGNFSVFASPPHALSSKSAHQAANAIGAADALAVGDTAQTQTQDNATAFTEPLDDYKLINDEYKLWKKNR